MMETLLAPLAEITAYRNAEEAIQKQQFPLQISGCIESQKCQWIYGLTGESPKWKVIIAANELRAREIAEDYRMFDREVMYYPAKDVIFLVLMYMVMHLAHRDLKSERHYWIARGEPLSLRSMPAWSSYYRKDL